MKGSIRGALLKWLIVPLLLINLLGALLTYIMAWSPAQIAFDQSLADLAYDLLPHVQVTPDNVRLDLSSQAERMLRFNQFDKVYYVVRDFAGNTMAGDQDFPSLLTPGKLNDPMAYNGMIHHAPVRIVVLRTEIGSHHLLIGVAETLSKRLRIQSRILLALFILEAVLVITSVAIVWFAVKKGLLPLQKMQSQLDARSANELSPVEGKALPTELQPLANAINGLLHRTEMDEQARRNFLANVAHQLRTPLAGLKTQIELLQQKRGDEEAAQSIRLMMASTDRMVRQTNQFLALARAEPSQFEKARLEILRLDKLLEESIQHFVREADKRDIDLGFDVRPATVKGDRFLLRDLIDNLVDNAIRYSPQGGIVTVSCMELENGSRLIIEDSGRGIPAADHEKIFNRFYRADDKATGSGLGLSIVRDIAEDHDARIMIDCGAEGKGTRFSVQFPAVTK